MANATQLATRFRSHAKWTDHDWEQPLDAFLRRVQSDLAGRLDDGVIIRVMDQLDVRLRAKRDANEMQAYRRLIESCEAWLRGQVAALPGAANTATKAMGPS